MLLEKDLLDPDRPFVVRQSRPDLVNDAAFLELCRLHPDLRLETDRDGTLVIMSPTGWRSSNRNARIIAQLQAWADRDGTGQVSDSSGLFHVAAARRSPDAAWIRSDRLSHVPVSEREQILPIVPDFVIELRLPSDRIQELFAKMDEYVQNGVRLGWLIDPVERRCYEVRPGQRMVTFINPSELHAGPELPGFTLELAQIW